MHEGTAELAVRRRVDGITELGFGLYACLSQIVRPNGSIHPIIYSPKKPISDDLPKLIVDANMWREKPASAFLLDRKGKIRQIKHWYAFDPEGRLLHCDVVTQANLRLGGAELPRWHGTGTRRDPPAPDLHGAWPQPLDAFAHHVIRLGGFPSAIVQHATLGSEIKLDPAGGEIVSRADESDMPPGCPGIGVRMQLKLVGQEALVAIGHRDIASRHHPLLLLEILQRFRLESDTTPLLWRGRRARLRG